MRHIFFIFSVLILSVSCEKDEVTTPTPEAASCTSTVDNILEVGYTNNFTYSSSTEIFLDINNDGVDDFKFDANQAGNHITKEIVGLNGNTIVGPTNATGTILDINTTIESNLDFVDNYNFNDLGAGSNAHFDNKYLGLKFDIGGYDHFGWIKFSSTTDGGPQSNTPVYYLNLTLDVTGFGYNEGCNLAANTQ